jgi:hypothetical protein
MDCTPAQLADFAAYNVARIFDTVTLSNLKTNPWMDTLGKGVWPYGEALTHQTVVGRESATGDPLAQVAPTFTNIEQNCASLPPSDKVGNTIFNYSLQEKLGMGPTVCLNQGLNKYKESYDLAAKSLTKSITKQILADNRFTVLTLSGVKYVASTQANFYNRVTGNAFLTDTPFAALTPNATITFKELKKLAQFLVTDLQAEQFEGGTPTQAGDGKGGDVGVHSKVIASQELLDYFREDPAVRTDLRFKAAGGFVAEGKKQLDTFTWYGPAQGLAFAPDPQPLRLNSIPPDGVITADYIVPPEVPAAGSNGTIFVPNLPAYSQAEFEVGFLIIGPDSFIRQVPANINTLGKDFQFPSQVVPGELSFYVPKGPCDAFQRTGYHVYRIVRAIKPEKPHYIVPFLYRRCWFSNLAECAGYEGASLV